LAFIIRKYHDARFSECQIGFLTNVLYSVREGTC